MRSFFVAFLNFLKKMKGVRKRFFEKKCVKMSRNFFLKTKTSLKIAKNVLEKEKTVLNSAKNVAKNPIAPRPHGREYSNPVKVMFDGPKISICTPPGRELLSERKMRVPSSVV